MSSRIRLVAGLVGLSVLAAACSATITIGPTPTPTPPPPTGETPSPVPTGPGSAAAALAELCTIPKPSGPTGATPEGPTPPAIAQVEREVEQVRGLTFTERVAAQPLTQAELVDRLLDTFDDSYPKDYLDRRSLAWQTIGVIPPAASIRAALETFASGQVIGFYVPTTGELVFIGSKDPSPIEEITLAHELTHAIDDQHFGLERIDSLGAKCQDEAATAAIATVEGSAQYFSLQVARRFLTPDEQLSLLNQTAPPLGDVPPFIVREQLWPYTAGFEFITALQQRGGLDAVNGAIEDFPVSSEQIIHPERYPGDLPQPVDVPDLAPQLGSGWGDLDVQQVGEEWLAHMLELRIDPSVGDPAAAGWDGGIYRAWRNGDHVTVLLSTVWDTPDDAQDFADALQQWFAAGGLGQHVFALPVSGNRVIAGFATDEESLSALRAAA